MHCHAAEQKHSLNGVSSGFVTVFLSPRYSLIYCTGGDCSCGRTDRSSHFVNKCPRTLALSPDTDSDTRLGKIRAGGVDCAKGVTTGLWRKTGDPGEDLMLPGRVRKKLGKNTVCEMGLEKLVGVCYARKRLFQAELTARAIYAGWIWGNSECWNGKMRSRPAWSVFYAMQRSADFILQATGPMLGCSVKKRRKISTPGKPSAVPPTYSETTRNRKAEKPPLHHRPATPVNWLVLKVKPCPRSRTSRHSAVPRVLMCKGLFQGAREKCIKIKEGNLLPNFNSVY